MGILRGRNGYRRSGFVPCAADGCRAVAGLLHRACFRWPASSGGQCAQRAKPIEGASACASQWGRPVLLKLRQRMTKTVLCHKYTDMAGIAVRMSPFWNACEGKDVKYVTKEAILYLLHTAWPPGSRRRLRQCLGAFFSYPRIRGLLQCCAGAGRGVSCLRIACLIPLCVLGLAAFTALCRTYFFAMPAQRVAASGAFMVQYLRNTTF